MPSIYSYIVYGQKPKDTPAHEPSDIPQAEQSFENETPPDSLNIEPARTSPVHETEAQDAPVQEPEDEATPAEALSNEGSPAQGHLAREHPAPAVPIQEGQLQEAPAHQESVPPEADLQEKDM